MKQYVYRRYMSVDPWPLINRDIESSIAADHFHLFTSRGDEGQSWQDFVSVLGLTHLEGAKIIQPSGKGQGKYRRNMAIKEAFSKFWNYTYEGPARKYFGQWYYWATHSRLRPVIESARTLKRHLPGLMTYLKHRITNAVTEGLNSKIQSLKSNARGFRSFANYRISILFHCGKLQLYP